MTLAHITTCFISLHFTRVMFANGTEIVENMVSDP